MNRKIIAAVVLASVLALCFLAFVRQSGGDGEADRERDRTPVERTHGDPSDDPALHGDSTDEGPSDPGTTIAIVHGDTDRQNDPSPPLTTDPEPPAEYFVEGLVVTEDGLQLSGAEVLVYEFREAQFTKQALELFQRLNEDVPPLAAGRTDTSGYFRIPLTDGGKFHVIVTFPNRASGANGPVILSRQEPSNYLLFTLPPEVVIEGIVLARGGRSLAGVPICLVEKGTSAAPAFRSHQTTSGSDGRFRLAGLEPRSYILMAKPDGAPGRLIQQVEAPSREVVVRVDDLQELTGFVRDANTNRPVAGALVTAVNPISFAQTTSDESGAFTLELSGEDVDVMVTHADYLLLEMRVGLVGARTEANFPLQSGTAVRGRVVKNDGSPVPGALVGVLRRAWLRGDVRTTRADANGEFSVTTQGGGTDLILAKVPGWVPTISVSGALPVGAVRDLVLQPSTDITGVIYARGRPVAGAWVRLHVASVDDRLGQAVYWLRGSIEGWSGPDGSFELRDVVPYVSYQIEVRHPDHPDTWHRVGSLPTPPLEIVLTEGSQVEIVLTTPDGRPPSSAVIVAQWPGSVPIRRGRNGNLEGGSRFIAGSDGVAVLRNVPVGQVVLFVVAPMFVEERIELDVTSDELFTHELQLRPSGRIDVHVLTGDGEPVAAAEVRLMTSGAERPEGFERRGRTGIEGEFSFTGIPPGSYQVLVTSGTSGQTRPVSVTATEPTEIEIRLNDA
ncbi:MAG: carboxypeptidase regulatory-like domain-containing protein [Planctomycetota bacterium]